VLGVVSAAAALVFAAELSASARSELDARGRALLRTLERHEDLRLAAALDDAKRLDGILSDVLGADRDALYLGLVGPDGRAVATASRLPGGSAALARELALHPADGPPPSSGRVRRFTQPLRGASIDDSGLPLPGAAAAPSRSGRLVLGLDASRSARQVTAQAVKTVAVTGAVLLAAFLAFFWTISRRAARMVAFAERLAAGDLGARLDDPASDELGRLAAALGTLRSGVDRMVRQLRDGSGELHTAAGEVLQGAEAQVALADRQGSTVQDTNAVVLRLRDGVRDAGRRPRASSPGRATAPRARAPGPTPSGTRRLRSGHCAITPSRWPGRSWRSSSGAAASPRSSPRCASSPSSPTCCR